MQFNHLAVNYDVMGMMPWLYCWDNFLRDLPLTNKQENTFLQQAPMISLTWPCIAAAFKFEKVVLLLLNKIYNIIIKVINNILLELYFNTG